MVSFPKLPACCATRCAAVQKFATAHTPSKVQAAVTAVAVAAVAAAAYVKPAIVTVPYGYVCKFGATLASAVVAHPYVTVAVVLVGAALCIYSKLPAQSPKNGGGAKADVKVGDVVSFTDSTGTQYQRKCVVITQDGEPVYAKLDATENNGEFFLENGDRCNRSGNKLENQNTTSV